jgi:hypothetical protein
MGKIHYKKPEELKGYHWHHIIPSHLGGTDDKENLILLSPYEHAMEHLKLYKQHGRQADAWAYNRLIRQSKIDLATIRYLKPSLGLKFSDEINKKKGRSGNKNAMSRIEVKEKHKKAMELLRGSSALAHKGGDNPSAKKVKVNEIIYDCINSVAKTYNVSRVTVRQWIKGSKPNKIHKIEFISFA